METRELGRKGPQVSAVGLGCMSIGLAHVHASSAHDDSDALALIHRALDLGVTPLDTANICCSSRARRGADSRNQQHRAAEETP